MPLTPPTPDQIATFRNEELATEEIPYIVNVAQQATDAVWATTGLEDDPSDERTARVLLNALCQFSLWLMAQDEHRDEINSPFSSERIGSYSYSKLQQAQNGEETGIFWLDLLFRMLNSISNSSDMLSWSNSEHVFNPDGLSFAEQQMLERREQALDWYGG